MKPPPPKVKAASDVEIRVTSGPCVGSSSVVLRSGGSPGQYTVGREKAGNVLHIPDPEVSSRHLEIYERRGRWVVCDLGSLNGTVVDEVELKKPRGRNARGTAAELNDRSVVQLGGSTEIEVRLIQKNTLSTVEEVEVDSQHQDTAVNVAELDASGPSNENEPTWVENDPHITLEEYLRKEVTKIVERCDKRTRETLSSMKEDMVNFRRVISQSH